MGLGTIVFVLYFHFHLHIPVFLHAVFRCIPHMNTPIYTPHLYRLVITGEGNCSVAEMIDLFLIDLLASVFDEVTMLTMPPYSYPLLHSPINDKLHP